MCLANSVMFQYTYSKDHWFVRNIEENFGQVSDGIEGYSMVEFGRIFDWMVESSGIDTDWMVESGGI